MSIRIPARALRSLRHSLDTPAVRNTPSTPYGPPGFIIHDLANTLQSYFQASGYQAWVTNRGEEALVLLEQHRPDVLLVDWKLEGSHVQGLDVLQKAKQLLPGVIVLMLSGFGETERAEAMQRGADAFLEKPLMLPDVRKAVQDALAKRPHTD